ncbi:hypothetical protein CEP51_008887 [Fusarium floridanum]|uniref:Uncharacterized protein n=1 Tax=Fusarium floridanum TaxID=1325733 RepID=A0A428RJD8_9HYPO|nr:hypothetical protein CEP51_008887 [Fusarium floridanum]
MYVVRTADNAVLWSLQATIAPDCNESLPGFSSAQVTSKSHNFLPTDEDPVDKGTGNRPNTAKVIPPWPDSNLLWST